MATTGGARTIRRSQPGTSPAVNQREQVMAGRRRDKDTEHFSPEIDRQIIEGFLGDRDVMLRSLEGAGISREAIFRRAGKLGLTRDFLEQCRFGGVEPAVRRCLNCNEAFVSLGPQNRLCKRCRTKQ